MAGKGDNPDCRWTPTGPVMEQHWKRIGWDIRYLFKKTDNPYDDKDPQMGIMDLPHAVINIPVEYARACPHRAGHWFWWNNTFWITAVILLIWGEDIWNWIQSLI